MDDALKWMTKNLQPLRQGVNQGIAEMRSGQAVDKMTRQISDFTQFASEKLGTAEDITQLPPDYVLLERRVDAMQRAHQSLLGILKSQSFASLMPQVLQEAVKDLSRTISLQPSSPSTETVTTLPDHLKQPKTIAHAVAAAAVSASKSFPEDESIREALAKYSNAQEIIGHAKLRFDRELDAKFAEPFKASLHGRIAVAMKARREVQAARIHLDACRAKFRSSKPEKLDSIRSDFEKAEDAFVTAVEHAQLKMRDCVDNPEPLKNLHDLVQAELEYMRSGEKALKALASDLNEMHLTQEALYRTPTDAGS